MGEHLEKLSCNGWETYPISSNLAFAMTPEKILILTPLASYIVTDTQLNAKAGHARIRRGVLNGEYKHLYDVMTDMRLTPGVGVGMRAINIRSYYD